MEMGFPRKAVEQAAKALGGIGDMTPSPESIVGWLLEHQALVSQLWNAQSENVFLIRQGSFQYLYPITFHNLKRNP